MKNVYLENETYLKAYRTNPIFFYRSSLHLLKKLIDSLTICCYKYAVIELSQLALIILPSFVFFNPYQPFHNFVWVQCQANQPIVDWVIPHALLKYWHHANIVLGLWNFSSVSIFVKQLMIQ